MKNKREESRVRLNNKVKEKGGKLQEALREIEVVADGLIGITMIHLDRMNYNCFHAVESLKMSIELLKHSLRVKEII